MDDGRSVVNNGKRCLSTIISSARHSLEPNAEETLWPLLVVLQVLLRKYGKEADIWSIGVILYILLSGVPPFYGENDQQIFEAVIRAPVDFDSSPWPKISKPAKVNGLERAMQELNHNTTGGSDNEWVTGQEADWMFFEVV